MLKPISISLSPNVESDDIRLAFKMIFQPWKWKQGPAIKELEDEFKKYLGVKHAYAFNSGRSSLMAILNSIQRDPPASLREQARQKRCIYCGLAHLRSVAGGDVLLQSFTCNAAINPIIWSGLKPVYVDVNKDNFNMDVNDIQNKINKDTNALMVQHTFGIPAEMDKIKEITEANKLILIEDCAHALGAEYDGQKVGTIGDIGFFSFSRDKIISSVYGGMVVTNNDEMAKKIEEYRDKLEYPSLFWIKQQLGHPLLMNLILPSYSVIGKYFLVLFQKISFMSKAVHWKEKKGQKPSYFPKRMPNALAVLALNQLKKLERYNKHRQEILNFYTKNLSGFEFPVIPPKSKPAYLRLPIKHPEAHKIIKKMWKKNILIGDWYTSSIAPSDTKIEKFNYNNQACPNAEVLSKITLNLPTHINISKKNAQKIIDFLDSLK